MKKNDIIEALDKVIECFDELAIAYYIGDENQLISYCGDSRP